MPLQKLDFRPGINREAPNYTTQGGWWDCDKVRWRNGLPEKIGGWTQVNPTPFLGACRSLWDWTSLDGRNYVGVGTHLKFYVQRGAANYDITPIRETQALTDPFDTTSGSATVTVTDVGHGALTNDYVTFSGASAVGGLTIDGEYQITKIDADTYTIEASSAATGTGTGGGSVTAAYQINTGSDIATPAAGWGAGPYGSGTWGTGGGSNLSLRLWSQGNFGEDLLFCYRGGKPYIWDTSGGVSSRATFIEDDGSAVGVPTAVNVLFVSDIYRYVFAFGTTPSGSSTQDPMHLRWADQESYLDWTPTATNAAGSLQLSHGSEIITAIQARQEIVVLTDEAVYGLQFLGAPDYWGAQLLGDGISIASPLAAAFANNTTFWMGKGNFYRYDGTVRTLPSDVRRYVFNDINTEQYGQVHAGVISQFSEVWWFYCSEGSDTIDRYVAYNYDENFWFIGALARTAWLDDGIGESPIAATYNGYVVKHEQGVDDLENGAASPAAISSYVTASMISGPDGRNHLLTRRVFPDITFDGSTADSPSVTLTLTPLAAPGAGYKSPASVTSNSSGAVTRSATAPIEEFTDRLYLRVRGRNIEVKLASSAEGVAWQMGTLLLDVGNSGTR